MHDAARWQEYNGRHLEAALAWLRLRLAGPAEGQAADAWDGEVAEAAAALAGLEAGEPLAALVLLGRIFGLSRFERETLLLCAATELDPRIGALCARAQGNPDRLYPTFALALSLFEDPAWDVLSPARPLRRWRLIEVGPPGPPPLTASPLRADERIVHFLKGLNQLDERLAALLAPPGDEEGQAELTQSQQGAVAAVVRRLEERADAGRPPLIHLRGPDVVGKRLVARRAAAALGLQPCRLPAEALPADAEGLEALARLWRREATLLPICIYLDAAEAEGPAGPATPLGRFLDRVEGIVFLDAADAPSGFGRATLTLDVDRPEPREQRAAWSAALGPGAADLPERLAGQFDLDTTAVRQIALATLDGGAAQDTLAPEVRGRLWDACRAWTRTRLDALAQRLDPRATWDDLVLPDVERITLQQVADQVRRRGTVYDAWGFRRRMARGLGISVLFAGESGTGKTMAAEVLAHDLRLDLYRIDLSAVVSKYIGETEKNLRRLFDAAEHGGAILFFDEADALFGKRSEVKDSHDRYANIEISYLLQRMESYRGLAILATNMKGALDPAFLRRLRFVINFPFPGVAERGAMWQRAFPSETPTAGLDPDRLARLALTGGSIQNIALNASFLAAGAGSPVTMRLVLEAARAEFRKLERPDEADFL